MKHHTIRFASAIALGLASLAGLRVANADGGRFLRHWGTWYPALPYHGGVEFCIPGGGTVMPGELVSVSANGDLLIMRESDGERRGWGDNSSGVFSWPPVNPDSCVPHPGPEPQLYHRQLSLSIVGDHAAAIVDAGSLIRTVICWGSNLYGECDPPTVGSWPLHQIYQVSCGAGFTVARQHNGHVVAWGRNDYGQSSPPAGLDSVVDIAAGGFHCLALRSSGTVVGWGAGSGAYDGIFHCDQSKPPEGLTSVVKVAAGGWHSVALRSDGSVVCWGAGSTPPNYMFHHDQSQPPSDLGPCRLISAGAYSTAAVTVEGHVRRWGSQFGSGQCVGQCDVFDAVGELEQIHASVYGTFGISNLDRPECSFDIEPNCSVDGGDLAVLIADWGKARPGTSSDLDQSGAVDAVDLAMILSNWGSCPD